MIAVLLPSLEGGGAERCMLNVAIGLAADDDVELVLGRAEGPLLADVPPQVRVVDLGARRTALAVVPLVRYLRRRRPDALLSSLTHANVAAVAARGLARTGTRLVVTEHSDLTRATGEHERQRDRLLPAAVGLAYRRADAVTAVSVGVADDVASRGGLDRSAVTVVPNPLDVDGLRRAAAEPLDHPWLAPGGPPVVVAAGRLTPAKDYPTLVRAVADVRSRRPVRLVVLGEGDQRSDLEALVASLGLADDVALPGFVANPYPWLRAAAVVAMSSRWEGLPTVLLEALAVGAAVVSTDCPSGPGEILDGGRLGRLVPVGDASALAAAIEATLDAPPPPATADDLARYRPETVLAQYRNLLRGT